MPRDVRGKHLKRIWELEFPEEETEGQPVNMQQQPQQGNGVYKPQQVNIIQSPGQFQQQQFQQVTIARAPNISFFAASTSTSSTTKLQPTAAIITSIQSATTSIKISTGFPLRA